MAQEKSKYPIRQLMDCDQLKLNPNNPRLIKDAKFKKLVRSLQEFPEMLQTRPVVVNTDFIILGGNMRFKAALEAGWDKIWVEIVDWDYEQQRQFIIKDNVSGGEWDWEMLANEWNSEELIEWGIDAWKEEPPKELYPVDQGADNFDSPASPPDPDKDDYSTFELILLYENKNRLIDCLNKVKVTHNLETNEEALMKILDYIPQ